MMNVSNLEKQRAFSFIILLTLIVSFFSTSCEPEEDRLGVDIFPPSDTILIYADTLTNFQTSLVRSRPRVTSIDPTVADLARTFFLGSIVDTMTGLTKADIVTEFGISQFGDFGENPIIDSLTVNLYFSSVVGDTAQEMHLRIYEFLDSLDINSSYYSDYNVSGKFDPDPLVDEVIVPKAGELYTFEINDPDLLQRIYDATIEADSNFFFTSRLQGLFPGLYITTEAVDDGGALARVQLGSSLCGLKFKYYHDTITTAAMDTVDMSTYSMSFNQYNAQKVNTFLHDYAGTPLENIIDNPDANSAIAYAQGMAGVNVKLSLPDISEVLGFEAGENIAINAANILFYVVPDSISGISESDYPEKLMMETEDGDGERVSIYDELINTNDFYFGKLTRSNEQSAFYAPLYFYNFHIGRHLQSIVAGELDNTDLYIYLENPEINAGIIKFWSNYSGQSGGLRLELIYTKF